MTVGRGPIVPARERLRPRPPARARPATGRPLPVRERVGVWGRRMKKVSGTVEWKLGNGSWHLFHDQTVLSIDSHSVDLADTRTSLSRRVETDTITKRVLHLNC